jgi:hypothetical protein
MSRETTAEAEKAAEAEKVVVMVAGKARPTYF